MFYEKKTEEIIVLLFIVLFAGFHSCVYIQQPRGFLSCNLSLNTLPEMFFLEDIDNGFLWLFRIPMRLYIYINDFILHLSVH